VADIVIIEDDPRIRDAVCRALMDLGHTVRSSGDGLGGLRQVMDEPPEVVILDLGLPDVEGSEILKMLRAVSQVPVIVATARDDESEIVTTLDAGADDYVIKPYSAAQIEARIRAVLRRSSPSDEPAPVIEVGGLRIDVDRHEVVLDGEPLELSRKEFELLAYLADNAGQVVTKRQLLADIWGQPYGGADKTVDVHLSWLRRKLGETAAEPRMLRTIRGVGVKLVVPDP
jgi:DNA-binding response OmpR family regulator